MSAKQNVWLLWMCFFAYTISYVGKYSYSTNIQNVIVELQISKASAGLVSSAYFLCYGAGQLINGFLCEKFNSKWTVALSLWISAGITLLMSLLTNVLLMTVLWGLNGLVLSVLWSHCVKLLATIREQKYVKKSVTMMALTTPVGCIVVYSLSALFTYLGAWKAMYLFSSAALALIGTAFLLVVGKIDTTPVEEEKPKEKQEGLSLFALFGPLAIGLFIITACAGFVRDGITTWFPVLLSETFSIPDFFSILLTIGLPIMGVFSAMLATPLMKWTKNIFGGCVVAGGVAVLAGVVLALGYDTSILLVLPLFMLLRFSSSILANTTTSLLPLSYKGKLKSGQAAGILNGCAYVGSVFASFFLGSLVDNLGWLAFMICMLLCAAAVTALSLWGWFVLKKKEKGHEN